eukprot:6936402-Karenia_brevis.AAC.1
MRVLQIEPRLLQQVPIRVHQSPVQEQRVPIRVHLEVMTGGRGLEKGVRGASWPEAKRMWQQLRD